MKQRIILINKGDIQQLHVKIECIHLNCKEWSSYKKAYSEN